LDANSALCYDKLDMLSKRLDKLNKCRIAKRVEQYGILKTSDNGFYCDFGKKKAVAFELPELNKTTT